MHGPTYGGLKNKDYEYLDDEWKSSCNAKKIYNGKLFSPLLKKNRHLKSYL